MRPDQRDVARLWDMLRYARKVQTLTHGATFEDYQRDEKLRLAVERAIEIVGEASRGITDEYKAAHPGVPWKPIAAQRHIIAHEYGELADDRIWRVATQHIPALITLLEPLVPAPPSSL